MKNISKYYYGNTTAADHRKTNNFIKKHQNEKKWFISLYFDIKRLAKYQRNKKLFWDGCDYDFNLCKTSDLTKYNGLFTFEQAMELFEKFDITQNELVRLNFLTDNSYDRFVLVRE